MHQGLTFKRRAPKVTDPKRRETKAHFTSSADQPAAIIQEIHALLPNNVQEDPQTADTVFQHNTDPEAGGQAARNGPEQVNISESDSRTGPSGSRYQTAELL